MQHLKDCKSGEYDSQAAHVLCHCAGWAYLECDKAYAKYAEYGFDMQRVVDGSTSCDFATCDGATVVAFAGTDDPGDWVTNLNVGKVDWDGYQLHAGFHGAESGITSKLMSLYTFDTQNLWVTGHSLGGALATLHALRFAQSVSSETLKGVYTFGSPRCMDRKAAAMCDQLMWFRHYRHTHGNDIVPRLPSCFRFKHCGQHLHINRKRNVLRRPDPLALLIDRVLGFRADMVRNHFVEKYQLPLLVASL